MRAFEPVLVWVLSCLADTAFNLFAAGHSVQLLETANSIKNAFWIVFDNRAALVHNMPVL
jgi:hypothetical protein